MIDRENAIYLTAQLFCNDVPIEYEPFDEDMDIDWDVEDDDDLEEF